LLTDKEILEKQLDTFTTEGWKLYVEELANMVEGVNDIGNLNDEKSLWYAKGQLMVLNMVMNMENFVGNTLDNLDEL